MKSLIRHTLILAAVLVPGNTFLHAQCTVSTIGVNFGSYDPLSPMPADSTGVIDIDCTRSERVAISIGASPNSGGFNPRRLRQASGLDFMDYNLYTESDLASIWGDGSQGTSIVYENAKKKKKLSILPIYARAPAGQDVRTGQYSESLLVTINF